MTVTTHGSRSGAVSRRIGYSIGIAVNTTLLILINVEPGWRAMPFLTADARQLIGLVSFSLALGIVANAAFLVYDRRRFKAAGDFVTTSVALVVLVRLWQVFPFDFTGWPLDGDLLMRVVLGVSIFGTAIAIVVLLLRAIRRDPLYSSIPAHEAARRTHAGRAALAAG